MATVRVPAKDRRFTDPAEIRRELAAIGIDYERVEVPPEIATAPAARVLESNGPIVAIEVEAGDSIRVPAGTLHWFDLCETRAIRAIRLFRDPAGWVPRYSDSGAEEGYQPVCFGPPRHVTGA